MNVGTLSRGQALRAEPPATLSASEARLWDITTPDGADRLYRAELFGRIPTMLEKAVADRYRSDYERAGLAEANLNLGAITDEATCPGTLILDSDEGVRSLARQTAQHNARIATGYSDRQALYEHLANRAYAKGVTPPIPDRRITLEGATQRLCCEQWWRRALRCEPLRRGEAVLIRLGAVHRYAGLYLSEKTYQRQTAQKANNAATLEQVYAINELDQHFTLREIVDWSVANLTNRRAEMMVRIAGHEAYARGQGHKAMFYTLTCPSRMHARLSRNGAPNPKYKETTPRQAQAYLRVTWSRIRAALKRAGVNPQGIRVAEPQHDGTPHWHLLLFMAPAQEATVTDTLHRYALAEEGGEPGAQEHRLQVTPIDPTRGTATGYVAKYIAKNLDGRALENEAHDTDPTECARRVRAWASTWGIRQFQFIGSPPVTVWRELRRLEVAPAGVLGEAFAAADSGDWCRYLTLMGGPSVKASERPITLAKAHTDLTNRYGEPKGDEVFGVQLNGDPGSALVSRLHQWRITTVLPAYLQQNPSTAEQSPTSPDPGSSPPLESCQ